jgi:GTP-binding protein Era
MPGTQVVFIDTPGIHQAKSKLNKFMVDSALSSLRDVDLILFLVEAERKSHASERLILDTLAGTTKPVYLVINKIDLVKKESLLEIIEDYSRIFPFREIIPVSAAQGDGIDSLLEAVCQIMPEGPEYFPDDILSDVPERFIVAEIIREKIFRQTHDEIPYSVAVVVESFKERDNGLIAISAAINVERDSQKGIIIGRKGEMLKKVGIMARKEIEQLLDTQVYLELFVRVSKDWTENRQKLKEFGYE